MHDSRRWSVPAVIGAIGIVYGDIGTSPLYALETAINASGTFDSNVVLCVLSLIFWSLTITVTFKYVIIMMRADNEGEGGIEEVSIAIIAKTPVSESHLIDWCGERGIPVARIFTVDVLPKTTSGKIQRDLLKRQLLEPDGSA